MNFIKIIGLCLLMFSCSTTELVENWKNPDIDTYSPNKILLVGMTSNLDARTQFEKQLKIEYTSRNIESVMSLDFFEPSFTTGKRSEEELDVIEADLINNEFDTILLTKIIGVEDKIAYRYDYDGYDSTYIKFSEDYLMYQDIFYNPDYYDEYTVYHTETSMYCICPTKERELIWKGYIDIKDPQSIQKAINDYVSLVIVVLEEQQLINTIMPEHILQEEAIN